MLVCHPLRYKDAAHVVVKGRPLWWKVAVAAESAVAINSSFVG